MKTIKMSKVLIALDYDPSAQKIAEIGFNLAKSMDAEVFLLHVITEPVYYSTADYSPIMGFTGFNNGLKQLDNIDDIRDVASEFLEKTKDYLGDESIKTILEEGDFAKAILSKAKSIHADLIVMGSHSKKWLENILMGSVAEEVLRDSKIPLFIIPIKKQD
ncbi:MAG: universal stress protein [Bacteroidota bacterium]